MHSSDILYGHMKHHCLPSLVHLMFTCTKCMYFVIIAANYKVNTVKKYTPYKTLQNVMITMYIDENKGYTILQY